MWYTNIHAASWKWLNYTIQKFIKGWSYGCLVHNDREFGYNVIIDKTYKMPAVTAIILDEFSV